MAIFYIAIHYDLCPLRIDWCVNPGCDQTFGMRLPPPNYLRRRFPYLQRHRECTCSPDLWVFYVSIRDSLVPEAN